MAFGRYFVSQLPGTMTVALVLWVLHEWMELDVRVALVLLGLWVVKDLALYRPMRRFYVDQPAAGRMIGERGTAVTRLAPAGLVRVHGELWQAHTPDAAAAIPEGASVIVRDIQGLVLAVEAEEP